MSRQFAALGLVVTLLLPGEGRANHDRLPDPPPQSTNQKLSSLPNPDRAAMTVSGLSSGGFFAHQFHIAFSKLVKGAGIIAGGPYGCVENIPNPGRPFGRAPWIGSRRQWWPARITSAVATTDCVPRLQRPRIRQAHPSGREPGLIDDHPTLPIIGSGCSTARTTRLSRSGSWRSSGRSTGRSAFASRSFGGPESDRRLRQSRHAGHHVHRGEQFPVRKCGQHEPPYVIQCGYEAAESSCATFIRSPSSRVR